MGGSIVTREVSLLGMRCYESDRIFSVFFSADGGCSYGKRDFTCIASIE